MVVPEQVENTVHDEQRQLVRQGVARLARLARRNRRADHDIADQQRRIPVGKAAPHPWRARLHRERQNVGRMVAPEPRGRQPGDLSLIHERQTQLGRASDSFTTGGGCRQEAPAVKIQTLAGGICRLGVGAAPVHDLDADESMHDSPAALGVLGLGPWG